MSTRALRLLFATCVAVFFGSSVVAFIFPSLAWPATAVAMVAGVAAGPIGNKLDARSRG
jgi:ABC-type uncharacterized transport system permease subunit